MLRISSTFLSAFLAVPVLATAAASQSVNAEYYSAEACVIFAEIDGILASHTTAEIRQISEAMDAIPADDIDGLEAASGLSRKAWEYRDAVDDDGRLAMLAVFGVLLNKHHPVIVEEFMEEQRQTGGDPAVAMLEMALENAESEYMTGCRF